MAVAKAFMDALSSKDHPLTDEMKTRTSINFCREHPNKSSSKVMLFDISVLNWAKMESLCELFVNFCVVRLQLVSKNHFLTYLWACRSPASADLGRSAFVRGRFLLAKQF